MDVYIESVVSLHLERCLHPCRGELSLRGITAYGVFHLAAYLGEAALGVVILLRVVVSGDPPGGVVACHGELGFLLLDDEVCQHPFRRKLIAESHSVVVYTETDVHLPVVFRLVETHEQFVVVVAYRTVLAPYGMPCLIGR